jgi:hypothetical protein
LELDFGDGAAATTGLESQPASARLTRKQSSDSDDDLFAGIELGTDSTGADNGKGNSNEKSDGAAPAADAKKSKSKQNSNEAKSDSD